MKFICASMFALMSVFINLAADMANRDLSLGLTYGNHSWSHITGTWLEPLIDHNQKYLLGHVTFMQHVGSASYLSRELSLGSVFRSTLTDSTHMGVGAYYRRYISWNSALIQSPRVLLELGHKSFMLTGNIYGKQLGSSTPTVNPQTEERLLEQALPGFDLIGSYSPRKTVVLDLGYYQYDTKGLIPRLHKGFMLAAHVHVYPTLMLKASCKYDKTVKDLFELGLKWNFIQSNRQWLYAPKTSDPDTNTGSKTASGSYLTYYSGLVLNQRIPLETVQLELTKQGTAGTSFVASVMTGSSLTCESFGVKNYDLCVVGPIAKTSSGATTDLSSTGATIGVGTTGAQVKVTNTSSNTALLVVGVSE